MGCALETPQADALVLPRNGIMLPFQHDRSIQRAEGLPGPPTRAADRRAALSFPPAPLRVRGLERPQLAAATSGRLLALLTTTPSAGTEDVALTRCSGAPSSHLPQPLSRLFEQLQQKCPTVLGLNRNCVSEAIYLHSLKVSSVSPAGIKHRIPVDAQGQGCSSRSTRDETRSYGPRNKAEHKHP